jgi:prepilin-type processing-associated H-X9-DG protein
MFLTYAAENKGSLPYGWYFNRSNPQTWDDDGGDQRLTTCFALISRMASKHYKGDDVFIQTGQTTNPENSKANYAPFLRCPEAEQVLPHIVSYVVSFVPFITPYYERIMVPNGPIQYKPAKTSDLMPFTILIHDTAIFPGMIEDVGYVENADVDEQWFWRGAQVPQRRYYDARDVYGNLPSPALKRFGNNWPVVFPGTWRNIDPPPTNVNGFAGYPYQGNLRFRHGKNDSVNVGYADGRVESITARFNSNLQMVKHDIPRKAFMIKWPAGMGIQRNMTLP